MNNSTYLLTGKIFFAMAIIAIGIVHLIGHNFPVGLMPVVADLSARNILIYIDGVALILAGALILSTEYEYQGACLAAIIWLVWLLALHLPKLIMTYNKPDEWTPTFEVVSFVAGALIIMGSNKLYLNHRFKLMSLGYYIFALGLLVFFALHMIYANYIATLIPGWVPFHVFLAYFAGVVFWAVAMSIFTRRQTRFGTMLLGVMFILWVLILHLPRVISNTRVEPEWTSMFVALGFGGISFLISGTVVEKLKKVTLKQV